MRHGRLAWQRGRRRGSVGCGVAEWERVQKLSEAFRVEGARSEILKQRASDCVEAPTWCRARTPPRLAPHAPPRALSSRPPPADASQLSWPAPMPCEESPPLAQSNGQCPWACGPAPCALWIVWGTRRVRSRHQPSPWASPPTPLPPPPSARRSQTLQTAPARILPSPPPPPPSPPPCPRMRSHAACWPCAQPQATHQPVLVEQRHVQATPPVHPPSPAASRPL